jgi:ABC-type transporter Mla MlaB component
MTAQRPDRPIVLDVSALAPDAGAIDGLARLQLLAKRQGLELKLCKVPAELQALLGLCGLGDVLRVEVAGQAEQREERRRVEEERQLGDLTA